MQDDRWLKAILKRWVLAAVLRLFGVGMFLMAGGRPTEYGAAMGKAVTQSLSKEHYQKIEQMQLVELSAVDKKRDFETTNF